MTGPVWVRNGHDLSLPGLLWQGGGRNECAAPCPTPVSRNSNKQRKQRMRSHSNTRTFAHGMVGRLKILHLLSAGPWKYSEGDSGKTM